MRQYKEYTYESALAPYMRALVAEGRSRGYIYNDIASHLYHLDKFWKENGYNDCAITPERAGKWIYAMPGISTSYQSDRVSALRSLAQYMNSLGIESYVTMEKVEKVHSKIHILDSKELSELFDVIDSYVPATSCSKCQRIADEYPIIFRLYYCCGLRNNEACSLRSSDIDLDKGIITIIDGKNQKDRLAYLPDDLRILASKYYESLKHRLGYAPYWFFPGRAPDKHIDHSVVTRVFRKFWNMTESSNRCDKRPTPHSLRHGFVVDRINKWILDGVDLNVMFIYLSKYLGHESPDESMYYYHLVKEAFRIVRQKDATSDIVIPEVKRR